MIPHLLFLLNLFLFHSCHAQGQMNIAPLMELLRPESMSRMAQIASELTHLAANNVVRNEQHAQASAQQNQVQLSPNARPSQVLGQTVSNINTQSRNVFIDALTNLAPPSPPTEATTTQSTTTTETTTTQSTTTTKETPLPVEQTPLQSSTDEKRRSPAIPAEPAQEVKEAIQPQNPFLRIANAFLGGNTERAAPSSGGQNAAKDIMSLGIRDFMPGANNNFGIPKGEGCLPFLSEFMQVAYGNCQEVADEKAFDAWGQELRSAILTGQIDLLRASQETCRRGAEREQCGALRKAIAVCDIMQSLQIGSQLQRAIKRCDDVSGLVDQNPMAVLGQIQSLIGGEFAQGFFNNFLGGKQ